jgi:cadmium resistance protein CadD (predicted permease)
MNALGSFLPLLLVIVWFGIIIYLVVLATKLVSAQERMADTLDKIARKLPDDGKS